MELKELELKVNRKGYDVLDVKQKIKLYMMLRPSTTLNIDDDEMVELSSAWFCEVVRIGGKVPIDIDIAQFIANEMVAMDSDGCECAKKADAPETWQNRFKLEYEELVSRERKLNVMVTKYAHGTLDFEPNCPLALLREQLQAMDAYRKVLEKRAEIEEVDIADIRESWGYGEVE